MAHLKGEIVEWRRVQSAIGTIATEYVIRIPGEVEPDEYAAAPKGSFGTVEINYVYGEEG